MRSIQHYSFSMSSLLVLSLFAAGFAFAQVTAFTYQGKLTDGGSPANGTYDMQFRLFDGPLGGTQLFETIINPSVQVTNGIFTVQLNFPAEAFTGAARFLDIGVRPAGNPNPYTLLTPRQEVTATPYSIRSISAASADTATNATQLGGISASGFLQNTTLQQASTNFNISGNGTLGGTLSANTVNATTQYNIASGRVLSVAGSNNVFLGVGAGTSNTTGSSNSFFGTSAGTSNTTGSSNSFFGRSSGSVNTTGSFNSFFGSLTGFANTTGSSNSFFGRDAGRSNTSGDGNSFFGTSAGFANTTGVDNAYFGRSAGEANTTGISNSFFGRDAGRANTSADDNSFFGAFAGDSSTTGGSNSFFGFSAGSGNTTGASNSFFGRSAGLSNTTACCNSFFGDNAGRANTTATNNSFFGASAGSANTTGRDNSFFGSSAGVANTTGLANAFFGAFAGFANTTGIDNSFFGVNAGSSSTTGSFNSFFGLNAGSSNTTADGNSFFGYQAGSVTTTGPGNSFFGSAAGNANTTGSFNSFFGSGAGGANTTGRDNSFSGSGAGAANTTGGGNSFFGEDAGRNNTSGGSNTFVGSSTGSSNTTEVSNTFIGAGSNGLAGISRATAIGVDALVTQSDSLVLGRSVNVGIGTSAPAGPLHIVGPALDPPPGLLPSQNGLLLGLQSTSGYKWIQSYGGPLALNPTGNNVGIGTSAPAFRLDVAGPAHATSFPTSSDARLKTNISQLIHVLDKIEKIRGVSFDWNEVYQSLGRSTGHREIGVVAQEVEAVFPELVTRWSEEGYRAVDYGRLTAVLVEAVKELRTEMDARVEALKAENAALQKQNAGLDARIKQIKQQQEQMEQQQSQIDSLKKIVCLAHPNTKACKRINHSGATASQPAASRTVGKRR